MKYHSRRGSFLHRCAHGDGGYDDDGGGVVGSLTAVHRRQAVDLPRMGSVGVSEGMWQSGSEEGLAAGVVLIVQGRFRMNDCGSG